MVFWWRRVASDWHLREIGALAQALLAENDKKRILHTNRSGKERKPQERVKDGEMYTMMFGCTSVIFSHQPSLGAGNPLTAGYCRQGVQVYSKSPILAVTFYFQSIFFQDSVHFCQLTTRSHLVLELRWIWWSANWDLRQGRTLKKDSDVWYFL